MHPINISMNHVKYSICNILFIEKEIFSIAAVCIITINNYLKQVCFINPTQSVFRYVEPSHKAAYVR